MVEDLWIFCHCYVSLEVSILQYRQAALNQEQFCDEVSEENVARVLDSLTDLV